MSAIHFQATPYTIGTWMVLRLPSAASAKLPSRGQVMVTGTLNGSPFHLPLEPDGTGSHWLSIDKSLQLSAHVRAEQNAVVEIEPSKVWPEPHIPADVRAALNSHHTARNLWNIITPMARWEWLRWINSTGQAETRTRRIAVTCSKLTAGKRRPCCFNRNVCCVPQVSKNGVLLGPKRQ